MCVLSKCLQLLALLAWSQQSQTQSELRSETIICKEKQLYHNHFIKPEYCRATGSTGIFYIWVFLQVFATGCVAAGAPAPQSHFSYSLFLTCCWALLPRPEIRCLFHQWTQLTAHTSGCVPWIRPQPNNSSSSSSSLWLRRVTQKATKTWFQGTGMFLPPQTPSAGRGVMSSLLLLCCQP